MARILGISPGTWLTGIAIFDSNELIEWRVLTFKGKWSKEKRQYITESLQKVFDTYSVQKVLVKVPDSIPVSKAYGQVLGVINVLCEQRRITRRYYTLTDLKKQVLRNKKANKDALASYLVERYPELVPEFHKRKQQTSYYIKIFEAVAAGHTKV